MSIVSSAHIVGHEQRDGRRYVIENHIDSEGDTHVVQYLAPIGTDYVAVRDARAVAISEALASAEIEEALNG